MDELISNFCFLNQVPRSRLNIFASSKGLIFGPLSVSQNSHYISLNNQVFANQGVSVNFNSDASIENRGCRIVLIVEKETVFHHLLGLRVTKMIQGMCVVTARGYPDHCTQHFIKRLFELHPSLIFLYLGDFDPFGMDIFLNYLFSTKSAIFENINLPIVRYVGFDREDISKFDLEGQVQLNKFDIQKLLEIKSSDIFSLKLLDNPNEFQKSMFLKIAKIRRNLD